MKTITDEILKLASNGNGEALAFLKAYVARAHFADDLVDKPGPPPVQVVCLQEADWVLALASPWFQVHRAPLVPVMLLGLKVWEDSHNPKFESAAHVLKAGWHDVVWAVALLTGGWGHLRECVGEFREYERVVIDDEATRIVNQFPAREKQQRGKGEEGSRSIRSIEELADALNFPGR